MTERLFVYGTLRSEFTNQYARELARTAVLLGKACVQGKLYRMKNYPAMRRSNNPADRIRGELYELLRPNETLSTLDAYEGPNYTRVETDAELDDYRVLPAWIYEWRMPLPAWRRIESGDYLGNFPSFYWR